MMRTKHLALWTSMAFVLSTTTMIVAPAFAAGTKVPPHVTLNIMLYGDQVPGLNAVVAKFEQETAHTLNTSLNIQWVPETDYADKVALSFAAHQSVDLQFNAPWLNMTSLAAEGDYLRLNKYFNDPQFPALHKYFTKAMLAENSFPGPGGRPGVYGVPLGQYFMDAAVTFYRKDLAEKFGIPNGQINTLKQLETYLADVKKDDPSMIPFVENAQQGYSASMNMLPGPNSYAKGVYPITYGSASGEAYIKNGKLVASYLDGQNPKGLAKFPAPFNRINYDVYTFSRQWHSLGYTQSNPLTQSDATGAFTSGTAGAVGGTLSNYLSINNELTTSVRGAQLGFFVTNPEVRNMVPHSTETNFQMWNYLTIPATSHDATRAMAFLNWVFSSQQNNNLFALGIPGVDYKVAPHNTYTIPKGVTYDFPGYELTWNPKLVPVPAGIPKQMIALDTYESKQSSYFVPITSGFVFSGTKVAVQEENPDLTTLSNFETPLYLGVVANPIRAMEKEQATLDANSGLQSALRAIQLAGNAQLSAYLTARASASK